MKDAQSSKIADSCMVRELYTQAQDKQLLELYTQAQDKQLICVINSLHLTLLDLNFETV